MSERRIKDQEGLATIHMLNGQLCACEDRLAEFKRKLDEYDGIGKQAIEISERNNYNGFALVSFRAIGEHMVPIVQALTPEQEYQIKRYLLL